MQTGEVRELVHRCATERDTETWRQFLDRFDRPLAIRVRRTLQRFDARISEDEHQDLLQETYCRLLEGQGRRLQGCRGEVEAAIAAYLSRVADSVVVDHLRSRQAAKRGGGVLAELRSSSGTDLAARMMDPRSSPEEGILLKERKLQFLAKCAQLVSKERRSRDLQVLYLAFIEGWTSREICTRVGQGMRPSTVDSLVHRLKKRLASVGIEVPRRQPNPRLVTESDP